MQLLSCLILFVTFSFSQIQHGGSPKYLLGSNVIKKYNVNPINIINNNLHPMVFQYANEYSLNIDILKEANVIETLEETIYYIRIKSEGAKSLALVFDTFYLSS